MALLNDLLKFGGSAKIYRVHYVMFGRHESTQVDKTIARLSTRL